MVNFWDPEDSNILDAHLTEVEDVFEDALSELPEEEKKSDDEEEEKEETSEETRNFAKEAAPKEEKKDMSKVHGLFNYISSTSKTQASVNLKKTRMPANLSTTIPMPSPRFLPRRRSTTYVMSASRHSEPFN